MPIKLELHGSASNVQAGLHNSVSLVPTDIHDSTSQVPASGSSGTISDKRLEILLDREIESRIAADEYLQEQIDDIHEGGARYILIEEKSNGSIDVSLLNRDEVVLSTQTITLTEKIIKSGAVDYANSKIVYTCNDDSTIEVDISAIVNAISSVVGDLANEVARAQNAEGILQTNIDNEATARANADTTLQGNIDSVNTDLTSHKNNKSNPHEVTKSQVGLGNVVNTSDSATPLEGGTSKFTTGGAYTLKTTLETSISDEVTRATGAEGVLESAISAEETRATNAETSIANDLSAEVTRAQSAEGTLTTDLAYEVSRATGAEQTLTTNLNDEITRAKAAEKTLTDNLAYEVSRATTAETSLGTRIDNLDLSSVGASGSYIKFVSQSNGLVSASTQTFDTSIDANSTDDNSPTSKAVKTYVDTYGGKIDTITINNVNQPIVNKNVEIPTVRTDINNQGLSSTQKANAKTNLDLNNVDNTSDANKPISTATQSALDTKVDKTSTGNKVYATDNSGAQTTITIDQGTNYDGNIVRRNDDSQIYVPQTPTSDDHASSKKYVDTGVSGVSSSLSSHTSNTSNPHSVTASQVGLGSVVNTGDSDTPVSGGTTKFTTGGAYSLQSTLQSNINTVDDKLNYNVHIEGNSDEISYNGDTVTKTSGYRNLKTGTTGSRSEVIQLANTTTAGLMSHTDYNQIRDNTSRIEALEGTKVRIEYTASSNPTASQIKTFVDNYLASRGITTPTDEDYNGVSVVVRDTKHIWNYYANNQAYKDDGLDTVTQFTNSVAGIVLGKSADGFVYAESDGTGSVYGWSDLKNRVSNLESADITIGQDITNLQNNKVDKVAGKGLSTNDFTDSYKSQVDANTSARHTHSNKSILDDITASYTTSEQTKLSGIETGAQVNVLAGVQVNSSDLTIDANKKVNVQIKALKTDNATAQSTSSSEAIAGSGTINLHKVSKTGSYGDLLNKPILYSYSTSATGRIQYLEDFTYTSAAASSTDTFVKSINAGSGSFVPTTKYLNVVYTSGTAITGSTTQYMHFSAGSTPSREQFTYATGNFTTAASMNFDTGSSSDKPYISSITGGSAVSPTTKYLHATTTDASPDEHTHSFTATGNVSLTSGDSTSTGAITYVESISSTGASDSGKYMHFSAGTTPPSSASFSGTKTNALVTSGTTKYLTASHSGTSLTVTKGDYTPAGSVALSSNNSTADGRVQVVTEQGTITGATYTPAGSVTLNENDSTATGRLQYVKSFSAGTTPPSSASFSGTKTNSLVTSTTTKYLTPSYTAGTAVRGGTTQYMHFSAGTTPPSSASFSGTKTNSLVTAVSVSTQPSVTISSGATGDVSVGTSITGASYTPAGTSKVIGTRATSGSGTSARRTLTITGEFSGTNATITPTLNTTKLSASASGTALSVTKDDYTPGGSVSFTSGTGPSLTFNTTSTDGEAYIKALDSVSSVGGSVSLSSSSSTSTGAITYLESSSKGDYTPAGSVTLNAGTAPSVTTKYMDASFSGTQATITPTISNPTKTYLGASWTGTKTNSLVTGVSVNSQGSVTLSSSDTTSTGAVAYISDLTKGDYTPAGSVSLTSGTAPSLTFNSTASGGEYYVTDVSGGTTSATTKYLTASFSGTSANTLKNSGSAVKSITKIEATSSSSTGDVTFVESVSGGSAINPTTKYMKFTAPVLETTTAYQITGVGTNPSLTFDTTSTNGEAYIKSTSSGSVGGSVSLTNTENSGIEYIEKATHTHTGASVNTTASAVTGISSGSVSKTTKYEDLKED